MSSPAMGANRSGGRNRPAAVSVSGQRRHGRGRLLWLALVLLIAIAAVIVLIVTKVSDQNDRPGVDLRDDDNSLVVPHAA